MNQFSIQIVNIIKKIPYGKVLSYGGVAVLAGNPRASRQVSWILKTQTKKNSLPWHRVISSKGVISIKDPTGHFLQRELLENEGIIFNSNGKIDLSSFMWNGI